MSLHPDRCITLPRVQAELCGPPVPCVTSCPVIIAEVQGVRFGQYTRELNLDHFIDLAFITTGRNGRDAWLVVQLRSAVIGELWFDAFAANDSSEEAVSIQTRLLAAVIEAVGSRMVLILREEAGGPPAAALRAMGFMNWKGEPTVAMGRLPDHLDPSKHEPPKWSRR